MQKRDDSHPCCCPEEARKTEDVEDLQLKRYHTLCFMLTSVIQWKIYLAPWWLGDTLLGSKLSKWNPPKRNEEIGYFPMVTREYSEKSNLFPAQKREALPNRTGVEDLFVVFREELQTSHTNGTINGENRVALAACFFSSLSSTLKPCNWI